MTFDPQAIHAFEHAGWQRASCYVGTFSAAIILFIEVILDAADIKSGRTFWTLLLIRAGA
jgi:hypothetical protein